MKTNIIFLSKNKLHTNFYILVAAAFLLRIIMAICSNGFVSDIACFGSWALRVYEGGFSSFYSPEVFTDYPPGYMYILYLVGAVLHHGQIDLFSSIGLVLIKLPAMLADLLTGGLVYYVSCKYLSKKTAFIMSALYLFNPAVLLNSVVWGQIDSILSLLIALLCLLATRGSATPAFFVFMLGLLIKPQMLIFTPVLLYCIYEFEILGYTTWQNFIKQTFGKVLALCSFFLAIVPFGLEKVIPQYTNTLGSYPYVSVNAYNFWAFLGLNWVSQDNQIFGIPYKALGTLAIVLLTLLSAILFEVLRRKKQKARYFIIGAFLIITTFTFSVRMHERYLFPAMLLLVFAFILNNRRSLLISYLLITVAHFFNVWHVLYYYDPANYHTIMEAIVHFSLVTLIAVGYFYYATIGVLRGSLERSFTLNKAVTPKKPVASKKSCAITKLDLAIMFTITLLYAVVAFSNLGYAKAPVTDYDWASSETISLSFEKANTPAFLCYYLKYEDSIPCTLQYAKDETNFMDSQSITMQTYFSWGKIALENDIQKLQLTNTGASALLGELTFLNKDGEPVVPLNSSDYALLFDESNTLPDTFDYRSQAYFDEIYYHRTIYEFQEGLPAYENTHPPLGKIFIWLGTLLFGMNPFGFRFAGALFGILMLPVLYLFAQDIIGNRFISTMATICFAFDFMHFTQTRLATIDVFIVFFIILMYFFMERYLRLSFYDTSLKKTFLPLGACGIAFGFGIASKWTGFYAGAGLAVLFFASLYKRYQEYKYASAAPNKTSNGISHKYIIASFASNTRKTIAFCIVFFVLIPAFIYIMSYIPFKDYSEHNLLTRMWNNQITMYRYHANLTATHPYSSVWYEWPTMVRPVFYYANHVGDDIYQGISAFGNPFVWYTAIPAGIYVLYQALLKHKQEACLLCVSFLSLLLPWTLVTRCTFLYHYFPCVPFLVLMIAYAALGLRSKINAKLFYALCIVYTLAVVILFVMFYPVISGMPVSGTYVDTFLRWLDSWVLILN